MSASELSAEQLAELRERYFYDLQDAGLLNGKQAPFQIPVSNVIAHYEGTYFVDDDFFCSMDT
tara:strand:- start:51566 stop:51754 length:189 start_codon:yes stop_codon:yes gene_type:complete